MHVNMLPRSWSEFPAESWGRVAALLPKKGIKALRERLLDAEDPYLGTTAFGLQVFGDRVCEPCPVALALWGGYGHMKEDGRAAHCEEFFEEAGLDAVRVGKWFEAVPWVIARFQILAALGVKEAPMPAYEWLGSIEDSDSALMDAAKWCMKRKLIDMDKADEPAVPLDWETEDEALDRAIYTLVSEAFGVAVSTSRERAEIKKPGTLKLMMTELDAREAS